MTPDDRWRATTGETAQHYRSQIIETRHWAFAEVVSNHPIPNLQGRSSLHFSNTDSGKCGWHAYGPSDLAVGTHVELFEFRVYGGWIPDFRVLVAGEE